MTETIPQLSRDDMRYGTVDQGRRFAAAINRHFESHPESAFQPSDRWWKQWMVLTDGPNAMLIGRSDDGDMFTSETISMVSPTSGLGYGRDDDGERLVHWSYPGYFVDTEHLLGQIEAMTPCLPPFVPYGVVVDDEVVALLWVSYEESLRDDGMYYAAASTECFVLDGHAKPALLTRDGVENHAQKLWRGFASGEVVRLGERLAPVDEAEEVVLRWFGRGSEELCYLDLVRKDIPGEPYLPGDSQWILWSVNESFPGEADWPGYPDEVTFVTKMGFRA